MSSILTERLALIPLNLPLINAALTDRALFEDLLGGVHVPLAWPQPDFADIMPILAETLRLDPALDRWTRLIAHRAEGAVLGTIGAVGRQMTRARWRSGTTFYPIISATAMPRRLAAPLSVGCSPSQACAA